MGKVKYEQSRSALVMKNTEKHTKKLLSLTKIWSILNLFYMLFYSYHFYIFSLFLWTI